MGKVETHLRKAMKRSGKLFTGTVTSSKRQLVEHEEALRDAAGKTGKTLKGDRDSSGRFKSKE